MKHIILSFIIFLSFTTFAQNNIENLNSTLDNSFFDAKNEIHHVLSSPYPNPSTNKVSVKYTLDDYAEASIVLRNVIGKKVSFKNINDLNGTVTFYINDLPKGIYFINIECNGVVTDNKKVIKH